MGRTIGSFWGNFGRSCDIVGRSVDSVGSNGLSEAFPKPLKAFPKPPRASGKLTKPLWSLSKASQPFSKAPQSFLKASSTPPRHSQSYSQVSPRPGKLNPSSTQAQPKLWEDQMWQTGVPKWKKWRPKPPCKDRSGASKSAPYKGAFDPQNSVGRNYESISYSCCFAHQKKTHLFWALLL